MSVWSQWDSVGVVLQSGNLQMMSLRGFVHLRDLHAGGFTDSAPSSLTDQFSFREIVLQSVFYLSFAPRRLKVLFSPLSRRSLVYPK